MGANVVVEPGGTTGTDVVVAGRVVVEPSGPTVEVVVPEIIELVVVFAGAVVVVEGGTVVEVVVDVLGAVVVDVVDVVVVVAGVQSLSCCVRDPEPCGSPKNVQFVVAVTVCVPELSVMLMMSIAAGPVNWKSRCGPCEPSMTIDSCAVTAVSGNDV
jgi:hypothetical protein